MDMKPFGTAELRVPVDKLYRAVGSGGGAFLPSDDEPLPHGPWDPVVRGALARFRAEIAARHMKPHPEPWKAGPLPDPWALLASVMLNPQPLPPKAVWLRAMADEAIARAELMAELAEGMDAGEDRGIIIVSGYVSRFTGWCGNEPIVIHIPKGGWPPIPDPDPEPWWRTERLGGRDLLALGSRFAAAAEVTATKAAGAAFAEAAQGLALEGIARL
ncbi:MAG: hypothetical protein ACKVPY_00380 [Paracoccaceae bacterium]